MRSTAGAFTEVLGGFHFHDPLDGPGAAVLGLPLGVERQVFGQPDHRPTRLHPLIDVPLGLGHHVAHCVVFAAEADRIIERQAALR